MWGRRPTTFVNATVIAADGRLYGDARIDGDVISALGTGPQRGDVVIDLQGALVVPGLINAHDHLELNSFTRLKWRSHYANVREWIADFQPRFETDPSLSRARPDTLDDRLWVGGLKNLLSGVTTVCHHNPFHRSLRRRFPVRVVRKFGMSHSLQIDGDRVAAAYRATPKEWPWIVHAAEGIDRAAREEITSLAALGCVGRNTVLVHGVAIDEAQAEALLERGTSLVWCPSSNEFLFGHTANVRRFDEAALLALGTDSRLSGERDLLDELRVAHRTCQLPADALFRAVTTNAARMFRLTDAGRLAVGRPADLAVIGRPHHDPFEGLVSATRADVRLTMINGMPLIGDGVMAGVFAARRESYVRAQVDGCERLVATWIGRRSAAMRLREPGFEVAA